MFGIDIDGTLGDYYGHFFRFAEGWLGKVVDMDYDTRVPMYRHLEVSKTTYRQCKLAYRMGGLKRSMPPVAWAPGMTRLLRLWGADVWICTTRPYLSHDNIDSDTRHWLRRNRFACQGVIWGENKYKELARTVGRERIVTVLDDLPEMCTQAINLGIEPVFALRMHNRHEAYPFDQVAETEEETLLALKVRLEHWRGKL